MIQLTFIGGEIFYINIDHILMYGPQADGGTVVTSGGTPLTVAETPQMIAARIDQYKRAQREWK